MRREEWLTVFLEVLFTCVQQTVDPWQQFLGTVVCVQDNRHAILLSHQVNMVRTRDSAENCRALWFVSLEAFTRDKCSTAVRELDNDWRFNFRRCFQCRIDRVGADAVYGWQCEFVLFRNFEDLLYVITSDNAGFYEIKNFRHDCVLFRDRCSP